MIYEFSHISIALMMKTL